MSRRLIVRADAESDIAEAATWYNAREAGLGFDLINEVGAAIRRAVENPFLYLTVRKQPEIHRVLARRFPYRIFYIVREDAVVVFAVLHAARHDRNWKRRARKEQ
jgi:toxin ParE1/3/4